MSFSSEILEDVSRVLGDWASEVTYRPLNNSGNDKAIDAIVETESRDRVYEQGDELYYQTMTVWISSRNDVEGQQTVTVWHEEGVTLGDVIVIDSVVWYVRKRLGDSTGGMHHLLLSESLQAFIDEVQ